MSRPNMLSRRGLLQRLTLGAALAPLATAWLEEARAADTASLPLLAASAADARTVRYVEDAKLAPDSRGNSCANCALYQGAYGSTQGPCQIFPGRAVRAGGWCASWAPQL